MKKTKNLKLSLSKFDTTNEYSPEEAIRVCQNIYMERDRDPYLREFM